MGKTAPTPPAKKPEEKKDDNYVYFEDLPMWKNPSDNIPVFVAPFNCEGTMDLIESRKYKVYYLIASEKLTIQDKNKYNATVNRTEINTVAYKVVNNAVGRSVARADHIIDLWKPPAAMLGLNLALPKIPIELMDKIDSFFRQVHKELKTEAVVILTFNPKIGGPAGWGFVVPDQKNTAGSCDYDPPTVRERMPKDAFIAGSVHSHPAMSAYASHTDEGDQLGFDGIHITIGWSAATKNETEYYIEAQMQEASYVLKERSVFQYSDYVPLDEETMEEVMKYVEKGFTNTGKGYVGSYQGGTLYSGGTHSGASSSKSGSNIPSGIKVTLPKDAPDPTKELLVGVMDFDKDDNCPFCHSIITSIDTAHCRCMQCMLLLMDKNMKIPDLIAARKKANKHLTEFENNDKAHVLIGGEFHEVEVPDKF